MTTRQMETEPVTLPLCFILMPFGRKPGAGGTVVDFDAVYDELIRPAASARRCGARCGG